MADTESRGLIYLQDDKGLPKKIVVSVKAGENIGVAEDRWLRACPPIAIN